MQTACLFPAFTLKYTGKEIRILENAGFSPVERFQLADHLLGTELSQFEIRNHNFLAHEQENQLLSYIFSGCFSDAFKAKGHKCDVASGFSMGLYAALYHLNVLDFENGLGLTAEAFQTASKAVAGKNYGMASLIGFEKDFLEKELAAFPETEIVIRNGKFSYVLAGDKDRLNAFLQHARTEGALHAEMFDVGTPYHSKLMQNEKKCFENLTNSFTFSEPQAPLFSMTTGKLLSKAEDIKKEVVRNICQSPDFYQTIFDLNAAGINQFFEIGAGTALLKSSKFIEGDFEFLALAKGKIW